MTTIFEYSDLIETVYKDNDPGYISLFRKWTKGVYQRHYNKDNIKEGIDNYFKNNWNTDLYATFNTFYTPKRTIETLRYLNALYIDIDCYKVGMRKESVLFFLENDFYNSVIPTPTYVIDSGRGLYLVWLIEQVPSKARTLWSALEHYLYNALKSFGADVAALDPARILRVVGSYNSKSDSIVKVLDYNPVRYSLKELKDEYLPKVERKEKKEFKGKLTRIFNIFSLYKARINDLETLAELRNYDMEGNREIFLFLYRYYLTIIEGKEIALERTIEINDKFIKPLSDRDVIKDTYSRYIGKYKYKNSKIIELLDISNEEMKHLTCIISKELKNIKNNERRKEKRRNVDGLTTRELSKRKKLLDILKLTNEGKSNKDIATILDITLRMVQKYQKMINDNCDLKKELIEILNIKCKQESNFEYKKNIYIQESYNEIFSGKVVELETGT